MIPLLSTYIHQMDVMSIRNVMHDHRSCIKISLSIARSEGVSYRKQADYNQSNYTRESLVGIEFHHFYAMLLITPPISGAKIGIKSA